MTGVSRVARLFDGIERDASSIRRDRRKNSIGDLFLVRAVKIGDVNGIIAFKSDVPMAGNAVSEKTAKAKAKEISFLMVTRL